jgi:hypothetical protein
VTATQTGFARSRIETGGRHVATIDSTSLWDIPRIFARRSLAFDPLRIDATSEIVIRLTSFFSRSA